MRGYSTKKVESSCTALRHQVARGGALRRASVFCGGFWHSEGAKNIESDEWGDEVCAILKVDFACFLQ